MPSSAEQKDRSPDDPHNRLCDEIFRGAAQLRACLPIDEISFVRVAGPAHGDARSFVLYSALDDITKALIQRLETRGSLRDQTVEPLKDIHSRLLVAWVTEPLRLRIRILLELLVHLVLWTTTNEQEFYQLYTMWFNSQRLSHRQRDFRDFFNATNENIALQIKMQDEDLHALLEEHPRLNEGAWFYAGTARRERRLKDLLKAAIPLMSANERSAVGQSYGDIYSAASADIHYGIDGYDHFDQAMKDPNILLVLIDMLAASALARVYQLAGEPDAPFAANVAGSLRSLPAADEILQDFKGRAEIGDVVFVVGGLAQVVEARATEYGTCAYRVRFLADPPIQEIEFDWFRASHVKVLFPFVRAEAEIRVRSGKSDFLLTMDAWAESGVSAWKIGLRERLRGGSRQ